MAAPTERVIAEMGIFELVPRNPVIELFYREQELLHKETFSDERRRNNAGDSNLLTRQRTGSKSVLSLYHSPSSQRRPALSINESARLFVDRLLASTDPGYDVVGSFSVQFIALTKKLRQQIMSRLFARLHRQLVVYNVRALFRAYLIYHRDDRLIHSICDVFNKRHVYDADELRREMLQKNTKELTTKTMRNKICQEVARANPFMLRVFDTRTLNYCRKFLSDSIELLHGASNRLPVIMCLNESDVDEIFFRCRTAHSRRDDFPIDLLPACIRRPVARLLAMRRASYHVK